MENPKTPAALVQDELEELKELKNANRLLEGRLKAMQDALDERPLPEAGGIVFGKFYREVADESGSMHYIELNITQRAQSSIAALDSFIDTVRHAKETYGLYMYPPAYHPQANKGQPTAAPAQPAPTSTPKEPEIPGEPQYVPVEQAVATPAKPAPAPTSTPAQKDELSIVAVTMSVIPEKDDKATLQFFEAGHKYPDIYVNKWPLESLLKLLPEGWNEDHLKAPGDFGLSPAYKVFYKHSEKKNSAGNRYKNVSRIEVVQ